MKPVRPSKSGVFPRIVNESERCALVSVALGNGTQYRIGIQITKDGIFVGVENHGAYEFPAFSHIHWGYVQDKLGIKYESDANNLADFLNDQFSMGRQRQGTYNSDLCEHPAP